MAGLKTDPAPSHPQNSNYNLLLTINIIVP